MLCKAKLLKNCDLYPDKHNCTKQMMMIKTVVAVNYNKQ